LNYQESTNLLLSLVDHERGGQPSLPRQKHIYDLGRMEALLGRLDAPHLGIPTVHVAGTKGKGSTAAMCDAVLHAAGYRTGFYSSPHLHHFRERIRLNTQPVSEGQFAHLVDDLWQHQEWVTANADLGPVSLFEFMTAMAFQCFKEQRVDFQTIEVGLGGRLDATNVVEPSVCVITSVSLDHTAILGDTLELIASEKAGIVKPGARVVIGPQRPPARSVILAACRQRQTDPVMVGEDITWQAGDRDWTGQSFLIRGRLGEYPLRMPLLGAYQLENAASAVATLESLREQGWSIPGPAFAEGFSRVSWPCRMEVLSQSPLVVADGAHNAYSIATLLQSLPDYFDYPNRLLIAGFSRDKSLKDMVGLLAEGRPRVIATRSRHPRSAPPQELASMFRDQGLDRVEAIDTVQAAVAQAIEWAGPEDLILGTGSLFVAAEVREALLGIEPERYPDLLPPDLRPSRASI
jgi:dihydrofolate synthase/folylpolyglutamate synthase